jgi:hypothetical protein
MNVLLLMMMVVVVVVVIRMAAEVGTTNPDTDGAERRLVDGRWCSLHWHRVGFRYCSISVFIRVQLVRSNPRCRLVAKVGVPHRFSAADLVVVDVDVSVVVVAILVPLLSSWMRLCFFLVCQQRRGRVVVWSWCCLSLP